jgi:hypothetical protein
VIRRDFPKRFVSSSPLVIMPYNLERLRPLTAIPSLIVAQPDTGQPSGARIRPFSSRLIAPAMSVSNSGIVLTPSVIAENQDCVLCPQRENMRIKKARNMLLRAMVNDGESW